MDMSSTINRHFQQTKNQFYQNSGYCDSRIDKQLLILDVTIGTTGIFDEPLHEPLKIDTLSDIYLDNFTTFKARINTSVPAFVLSIDQFPVKSNSNDAVSFNKIIIPNEDSVGSSKLKVHKARKMNYICSINPQTITKLSGSITDTSSPPATAGYNTDFRVIAEFIIVARN